MEPTDPRTDAGLTAALGITGLELEEERLYRLLVTVGAADRAHLADLAQTSTDAVSRLLDRLTDRGLVTTHGAPPRYVATAPDVAFGPLLLQSQAALRQAQAMVADLAEEHRANARRRDADQLVEVITGQGHLRQAVRNLQLSTHTEMLWFCRAGHVTMPSSDNDEEFAMLARGVRYRVVYERALLEEPGMIDNLILGVRAGEEARAVPALPVRLAIADRALALIPLVPVRDDVTEPTAALVRESNLLTALIALFESYWGAASPLQVADSEPSGHETPGDADPDATTPLDVRSPSAPISPDERELLSLLVAGVTDKAIATRLAVSTRTVQRRISDLMALTQAQTRMQLAWQVSQRGWLSAPTDGTDAAGTENVNRLDG